MIRRALLVATAALAVLAPVAVAAPAAAAPGPPSAPQYWFDSWRVPELWAAGARGQNVVIAEIDTGVNAAVPELAGKVLPGKDFGHTGGDGRVDRDIDEFGHGTAMASIMVAAPGTFGITGLAPDARVLPVAVPLTGTVDAASDDHLAPAIRWAVDHGAKVISMSLGGARSASDGQQPCPAAEQEAVYYALDKGAILLASAGNRGESDSAVEEPGVCLGVVSVGAVGRDGKLASFSSRRPYLTMTAPGVGIASLSRTPGAAYSGNGTSQATAIASAVVALVWSKYPKADGREILTRVLATLDGRRSAPDPGYGYGTVNAYRAVTGTVPAGASNPVYARVEPFLARYLAFATQQPPSPPKPAPARDGYTGTFHVASPSRLSDPQVIGGLAAALAGLIALVALGGGTAVRRNRRARAGAAEEPDVQPEVVDSAGVVWHQILDRDSGAS